MRLPNGLGKPRAILFDWDNTLVNSWPTIVECYHNHCWDVDATASEGAKLGADPTATPPPKRGQ